MPWAGKQHREEVHARNSHRIISAGAGHQPWALPLLVLKHRPVFSQDILEPLREVFQVRECLSMGYHVSSWTGRLTHSGSAFLIGLEAGIQGEAVESVSAESPFLRSILIMYLYGRKGKATAQDLLNPQDLTTFSRPHL